MTRTFFSKNKADQFAENLREMGKENVQVWTDRDGFKQTIYIVKWF